MSEVHLYLVGYDIANIGNGPKRWRHVMKALKRQGRRVQLSVFLCRATKRRMGRLEARLRAIMDGKEDRLMITDLGPAASAASRIKADNLMTSLKEFQALVV